MLKPTQKKLAVFGVGALSVCLIGGSLALAQTKQLKAPANAQVIEDDSARSQIIMNAPNSSSSSYSVVIENKTNPDGTIVQSRKVWQDGQLVEEEERTLDASEAQNALSATIQLPNGQVAPGGLFSSEEDGGFFGGMPSSPFEAIRQMEEQMREQQERMHARFEALRQQLSDPNGQLQGWPQQQFSAPGAVAAGRPAPSKFWIGTTIEPVPEFLIAQLPIEEKQGVLVQYVAPESPAAKAGLKRYDVLHKIAGEIVSNPLEVSKLVERLGASKVDIEYYRKGKLEKVELTIEERPALTQKGFTFGAPNQKNFRIVRPGLIVPESEAQPETVDAEIAEAVKGAEPANAQPEEADVTAEPENE